MGDSKAQAWLDAVNTIPFDGETLPPVPVDALADEIRSVGLLDEAPALALLDEINRLRKDAVALRAALEDAAGTLRGMHKVMRNLGYRLTTRGDTGCIALTHVEPVDGGEVCDGAA